MFRFYRDATDNMSVLLAMSVIINAMSDHAACLSLCVTARIPGS